MEIEKKYLLNSLPFDVDAFDCSLLSQGYISTSPVIRLRSEKHLCEKHEAEKKSDKSSDKYFLTVKGPGTLARQEFELELSHNQFENLWTKIDGHPVDKIRYFIPLDQAASNNCKLVAELDRYLGRLEGLLTVEVEFTSLDDAYCFIPPKWFGKDVTEDSRYGNSQLSKNIPPFSFT